MKFYLLPLVATLAFVFSSCKKDLETIEPVVELPEQPFFVQGEYFDSDDSSVRSFDWDMLQDEHGAEIRGTAITTGANENHKYVISALAHRPSVFLLNTPVHYSRDPFLTHPLPFIGVRFVSDHPKEEFNQPYTAAELEDLLQPGNYSFGTDPGEVEIVIIAPNGGSSLLSPKPNWEDSYNQLEVLSVEDYEYPATGSHQEPTVGKLVHLRGQAAINYRLADIDRTYYFKLEGKFLFTYE